MSSTRSTAIRERLSQYVTEQVSLRTFDAWFVRATRDVERRNDPEAEALTFEIFLRLAEYSNGDCTETDLKDLLRPLTQPATVANVPSG